jgi:hypothetical protein
MTRFHTFVVGSAISLALAACSSAPEESTEETEAAPETTSEELSARCGWWRFPGPCPQTFLPSNTCVRARFGYAHWELICAPDQVCPNGTVPAGGACIPGG